MLFSKESMLTMTNNKFAKVFLNYYQINHTWSWSLKGRSQKKIFKSVHFRSNSFPNYPNIFRISYLATNMHMLIDINEGFQKGCGQTPTVIQKILTKS